MHTITAVLKRNKKYWLMFLFVVVSRKFSSSTSNSVKHRLAGDKLLRSKEMANTCRVHCSLPPWSGRNVYIVAYYFSVFSKLQACIQKSNLFTVRIFCALLFSQDICSTAISCYDDNPKGAKSLSSHHADKVDVVCAFPFNSVLNTEALSVKTDCAKRSRLFDADKHLLKLYKLAN